MEKIQLSNSHKRALTSSLYLIEKLVDELEYELIHSTEKSLTKIIIEEEQDLQHYILLFKEIKLYIRFMTEKYELRPFKFTLSQIINSRKSKIWEVLCDTKSEKMKGRGEFPKEYVQEFDSDIDRLLKLTENI